MNSVFNCRCQSLWNNTTKVLRDLLFLVNLIYYFQIFLNVRRDSDNANFCRNVITIIIVSAGSIVAKYWVIIIILYYFLIMQTSHRREYLLFCIFLLLAIKCCLKIFLIRAPTS